MAADDVANDNDPDEYELGEFEIELPTLVNCAEMTFGAFNEAFGGALGDVQPPETEGFYLDLGDEGCAWMKRETFVKYYDKVPKTVY